MSTLSSLKQILVLDFETAWSKEYTLKKLTTEEYIRDPRFKAFGAAYHWYGDSSPPTYLRHEALAAFLDTVDWSCTGLLCHNAAFDGAVLVWRYGHRPAFVFDTYSMARALRGALGQNSLDRLAQDFNLPGKGKALNETCGLWELPEHDTWLCEEIFNRLRVGFPPKELRVIDATLRMFLTPVLELDTAMLEKEIEEEKTRRTELLERLGVAESDLASNEKFADLLRRVGVEPPTKISKTTGKQAFAFAKSDSEFQAFVNSENSDISDLCDIRLKVKSTLERTRGQRFLDIAGRGKLPVPLHYFGAHTGRWSASRGESVNLQNLKRGSYLRRAIHAPAGYVLVVADLSQIEVRCLAVLAGNLPVIEIFKSGQDPYAAFGAGMFGIPGMTKESHPLLRQSAKSALLGCGYGLGWANFAGQLLTGFQGAPPTRYDLDFARQLGVTRQEMLSFIGNEALTSRALSIPRTCSEEEIVVHSVAVKKLVEKYRAASPDVTAYWKTLNRLIESALYGGHEESVNCLTFSKESVLLPSGMRLRYPDLKPEKNKETGFIEWSYWNGKKRKKIYGGALCENVTQAVARCIMSDAMLRIGDRYFVALTVHDELVCLVKEEEVTSAVPWIKAQMTVEPKYLQGVPIDCSMGYHQRYGLAKD
jgi:hypothetical protein